ncbi:hypothetical protein E8E13_011256 [Curvularia kusanoi]|uniref:Integral membrane protein n=1 Tax=Curvularia kusanoi TaxID=90978 RepID=A0A9P4TK41_CURKU|nr:hypothetical protein E8E13_011256 [Curvularia kusanoi]
MARPSPQAVAPLRLAKPLTTAYTIHTLREALALHRFPAFCAVLIGGSTILQIPIKALLHLILPCLISAKTRDPGVTRLIARFLAALLSASASFRLLNNVPVNYGAPIIQSTTPVLDRFAPGPFDEPPEEDSLTPTTLSRPDLAGRTMDLTLFAVIRALDVVVGTTTSSLRPTSPLRCIARKLPTPLFCFSAATIMWSWFYAPSRLPRSYNAWISAAAELDHRLVLALRHARYGTFQYGKDTGMAPLLGSMARDYGLPEEAGDPAQTIPVPCELVHMGCGTSCEAHAVWRFWRGWLFAAKMYLPLQLVVLVRRVLKTRQQRAGEHPKPPLPALLARALRTAAHRSSFLGAFIALFYYGVCLSRTRVGPKLFSPRPVTPQMWDSGLCVFAGCALCGLSILAELPPRRLEVVLFVLPRAAATKASQVHKQHVANENR